jgi:tetratricopeptide (TPR) repeat protein
MSGACSGPRRARVLVQRGRVLDEQLDRRDQAIEAFHAAREADPDIAESFLALERCALSTGDFVELAKLYASEADRLDGPDTSFWMERRARALARTSLDLDTVISAYQEALATDSGPRSEFRHEYQALLRRANRWEDLAEALAAEAQALQASTTESAHSV